MQDDKPSNVMQPKIIKADIAGCRFVIPNIPDFYIGEEYDQGVVYKDLNAFESGIGVCYIPEYGFLTDKEFKAIVSDEISTLLDKYDIKRDFALCDVEHNENAYSRADIQQAVVDALNQECGEQLNEEYGELYHKFVEQLTCNVFHMVDWQSPDTYLNEIDVFACWEEFIK